MAAFMDFESEEDLRMHLMQRVRLFDLNQEDKWCERGIGKVTTHKEKSGGTFLLVTAEEDGSVILKSQIHPDTEYKKEQGRFIIWTENDTVLGMSFQLNAGCDDMWNIICQIQGKGPTNTKSETRENTAEEPVVQEPQSKSQQEEWFEEMLDLEHSVLSMYEKQVLEQLIELSNRLITRDADDLFLPPCTCPHLNEQRDQRD